MTLVIPQRDEAHSAPVARPGRIIPMATTVLALACVPRDEVPMPELSDAGYEILRTSCSEALEGSVVIDDLSLPYAVMCEPYGDAEDVEHCAPLLETRVSDGVLSPGCREEDGQARIDVLLLEMPTTTYTFEELRHPGIAAEPTEEAFPILTYQWRRAGEPTATGREHSWSIRDGMLLAGGNSNGEDQGLGWHYAWRTSVDSCYHTRWGVEAVTDYALVMVCSEDGAECWEGEWSVRAGLIYAGESSRCTDAEQVTIFWL